MLLPGAQDDFPEARAERQLGWLCAAQGSGVPGIRDEGLFSSAMARPQDRAAYGDRPDVADRAAAYAFGLARNHPFLDGNKRTAFVVMELFLNLNGWTLDADDAVCISMMLTLAAGELSEGMLAKWLRGHVERD